MDVTSVRRPTGLVDEINSVTLGSEMERKAVAKIINLKLYYRNTLGKSIPYNLFKIDCSGGRFIVL
jgi:hypothetical protein